MRLFITTLSMFSVIAFGYALAGYGGGFFGGTYRNDYIWGGLVCGFAFAAAAMWLWRRHREEFFVPLSNDQHPISGDDENTTNTTDLSKIPLDAPDWGTKLDLNSVTRYDPPESPENSNKTPESNLDKGK